MAMNSGKMRHRFKLYKITNDRDDSGEYTANRNLISFPWCEILKVSDTEESSQQISNNQLIKFGLRYSKQLENPSADMTVEFRGDNYVIDSVENVGMMNEKLILIAHRKGNH